MKKLLFIAVMPLLVISCKEKLSTQDKIFIDDQILLHNSTFGLKHDQDSSERRNALISAYMSVGHDQVSANKYVDSLDKDFYKKDKNWRYNPVTDPHLTFEKFMDYCAKNKYLSPKDHAKLLTPKE